MGKIRRTPMIVMRPVLIALTRSGTLTYVKDRPIGAELMPLYGVNTEQEAIALIAAVPAVAVRRAAADLPAAWDLADSIADAWEDRFGA